MVDMKQQIKVLQSEEVGRNILRPIFDKSIYDKWLNVNEAANYLGRSPRAVYNLVHRKQVIAHKLGGRLAFRAKELDRAFVKKVW